MEGWQCAKTEGDSFQRDWGCTRAGKGGRVQTGRGENE